MLSKRGRTIVGIVFGTVIGMAAPMGIELFDHIPSGNILIGICGPVCYIAAIILPLSVLVRRFCSIFSPGIRNQVAKYPIIHAIWFASGIGVILGFLIVGLCFPPESRGEKKTNEADYSKTVAKNKSAANKAVWLTDENHFQGAQEINGFACALWIRNNSFYEGQQSPVCAVSLMTKSTNIYRRWDADPPTYLQIDVLDSVGSSVERSELDTPTIAQGMPMQIDMAHGNGFSAMNASPTKERSPTSN